MLAEEGRRQGYLELLRFNKRRLCNLDRKLELEL